MPEYSNLELHATDSQVLGSLDSVSLPSEPIDIRNWFSSYVYESPELNTLDGFQDFDGSTGTFVEDEKNAKLGDIQAVDKSDNGLLAGKMGSLDGIVKCNESDELKHSKFAAVVSASSESLSLSSEPPDIKNWFSSYLYETPPLDTTDDFTISDYKEREEVKACNAAKIYRESDKDVRVFMDAGENTELPSHSRISTLVVKCTNLVKGTKQNNQSGFKDGHKVDSNPRSRVLKNELTSERVYQQMLPGQKTRTDNHGSVKELTRTNVDGNENNTKSDSMFIRRTSHKLLNMESYTGSQEGKYLTKSIETKDYAKESLEKKDLHVNKNSWRRPTAGSLGKENVETAFPENGFVFARKSCGRENVENPTRPQRVQFESPRKVVKSEPNDEKKNNISRQILSETSNLYSPNAVEITGKWHCPQKNKPNLGPPLKQLRLEQWIRRV